jgi:hypothetical protein
MATVGTAPTLPTTPMTPEEMAAFIQQAMGSVELTPEIIAQYSADPVNGAAFAEAWKKQSDTTTTAEPPPVDTPVVPATQNVENYNTRGDVPVPDQSWAQPPEGWQGNRWLPSADFAPGVQYQESMNASIPWLAPEDQQWAMQYLAAQQPETYGSKLDTGAKYDKYALDATPRELTPEQYYEYGNANRLSSAKAMLTGDWNANDPKDMPLIDPEDPLGEWMKAIMDTATAYGTQGEQVGNRRTRDQQTRYDNQVSSLLSTTGAATYGVDQPVYDLWSDYFRRMLAPTSTRPPVSEKAAPPSWRSSSYTASQPGSNSGYGYQNTNWG